MVGKLVQQRGAHLMLDARRRKEAVPLDWSLKEGDALRYASLIHALLGEWHAFVEAKERPARFGTGATQHLHAWLLLDKDRHILQLLGEFRWQIVQRFLHQFLKI